MISGKRSKSARRAARSSESPAGVDPQLVSDVESRVRAACDMLGVPAGASRIVVACSGGEDSAAALFAVRAARPQAHLIACYVDHAVRPRPSIARDRRAVKSQANVCDAEFACIELDGGSLEKSSLEAQLR